ncbi:mechanosensitive ion channel family protein, partial [Candidatus Marithioploca araucensis]|nr:mechanosensitive ion channel family protein [Candidatus Marithioploca araucensis]
PNAFRLFATTTLYSLAVLGIILFLYESIIICSIFFVLSVITIGFFIHQISDGVLLNIERSFRLRDWVKIGEFEEGEVRDVTWRTTHVKTRDGCIIIIPNHVALQSTVKNFCSPDDVFWLTTTVKASDIHAPERVKKILLDAVLSANKVLKEPPPMVVVTDMSDGTIEYAMSYCSDDYADKIFVKEDVLVRTWYHLNWAGITLPNAPELKTVTEEVQIQNIIEKIEIFQCLVDEEKKCLTKQLHSHNFNPGEIVCRQGSPGDSLFFIMEGVVSVCVTKNDGRNREVARLGVGNFFGEIAVLTGEMRTATVTTLTDSHLFEISKADFMPLIKAHPELAEMMSKVLGKRHMILKQIEIPSYPLLP